MSSHPDATVLTHAGNAYVVQIAGRRFPAIALQGDTVRNILVQLQDLQRRSPDPDVAEDLGYVVQELEQFVRVYTDTLDRLGREYPWPNG